MLSPKTAENEDAKYWKQVRLLCMTSYLTCSFIVCFCQLLLPYDYSSKRTLPALTSG